MESSVFPKIIIAAICFFMIFRKFKSHQENREINSSSSSSSSSSLAPSSSTQNWTHDVFLSFRGEDVRSNFLSHIHKEFRRKGITPFIDNEIKRGEPIGPELIRAIRGSKIAIILLSRNYASSKWCLDELVEIMNCRKDLGQIVMTIFYKVDPSDVKKQTGDFGKVFKKTCAGKSKEDIKKWTEVLTEVATIAGYHLSNWENEAATIERIATDVSNELINSVPSNDFRRLIGMRAHMENLEPFLCLESDEVRMIGIWGPSGIGKSTIARFLYSKYANQFQLCVFMDDIKRRYPRPSYDESSAKLQLHKEFLSQIINQEYVKINHLGVIQGRLRNQRVFVVLDDVDHLMQLDEMAENTRWFGPGSRIIITTQDKKILNQHGINHIYEVEFPCTQEALQIFCMRAFGQSSPYEGFEDLACEATHLSGNLPLGLRVMGSYFKGRSKHEWKTELPSLRTRLDKEIESILKFSYDALLEQDQDLFLYIACFFNHELVEKVEAYLAEDFADVRHGLHVLAEKSLISTDDGDIYMHDLLARFGKEINRKHYIQNLGKRQFLVDAGDIYKVLNNDTTVSRSVIGIDYKTKLINDELYKSDKVFEGMHSLKFLRIKSDYNPYVWHISQSGHHLPQKVKLLHWEYFPMKSLPSSFNPEFLVEVIMDNSNLEKLWEGIQTIKNLKWMSFSYSENLKELPDLSTAINLEKLDLEGCSKLVELPSSIRNAINLKILSLSFCTSLVELPFSIGNVINLEELDLKTCVKLVELPSSIGDLINLKKLNLYCCSSLVELPSSIGKAINLKKLDLSGCYSLVELPSSIGKAINLKKLNLSGCTSLVELPSSIGNIINLEKLDLEDCSKLVELPSSIGNAINLKKLNLVGCRSLVELPFSIGNAINLEELDLQGCSRLVELPSSIGDFINLKELNLHGCTSLVELPSSIGNVINLVKLDLKVCSSLVEIPSSIKNAINLMNLDLGGCTKLVSIPKLPESLENLDAANCESLERLHCSFHNTGIARSLNFSNCWKLNQEARDLIMTSTCTKAVLPGKEMPTNFTYRAIGNYVSVTLNGIDDMHLPKSLRLKVCFLVVYKENSPWNWLLEKQNVIIVMRLSSMHREKRNGINVMRLSSIDREYFNEHLYTFDVEVTVSSKELVFEFEVDGDEWKKIGECGVSIYSNA